MDTGLQILPLDVKLSDEEHNTVEQINDGLSRLASRKKSEIRALDDLEPIPEREESHLGTSAGLSSRRRVSTWLQQIRQR
jgi:hypothetical protein